MPKNPVTLTPEERRARREERRAKQRIANIDRAKKMHGAYVADKDILPTKEKTGNGPYYHVGCSGWFYWHWRGLFYKDNLPTNQWFGHYMKQFRTVELNAPFYAWPTVATVKGWRKQAGRTRFLYTVKVSELITHVKRFVGTRQLVQDFSYIADLLGPYMGCFLFQLPPSYHYSPARLKAIVSQLDPNRRNVVEFRHASWWCEEVYTAFRAKGIVFCSCSGPRMPDELIKTADDIYVRFHGTKRWYRHDYTKEELTVWATRIHACKPRHAWIYFNNDRDGYAIKNARQLLRLLKQRTD